jgi:hypothetical protein
MTIKELLRLFEEYYGEKYNGILYDAMFNYLQGYSEIFFNAAAEVIIKRFSRIYNKVPDIAIIEKNINEIHYSMPKPKLIDEPKREWTEEKLKESYEGLKLWKEKIHEIENTVGIKPMTKILNKIIKINAVLDDESQKKVIFRDSSGNKLGQYSPKGGFR